MSIDIQSSEEKVPTPDPAPVPSGSASGGADSTDQVKEVMGKIASVLGDAPEYVVETFNEYKRPITVIGLVLSLLIAIKMTFAILDAVNDIPVLAPTMELIGLIYTGWFVYRYLLKASNRQELLSNLSDIKDQVTGNRP